MTTRRVTTRKVEEESSNTEAPSQDNQDPLQGNQAPPQEHGPLGYQAPVDPQSMIMERYGRTF